MSVNLNPRLGSIIALSPFVVLLKEAAAENNPVSSFPKGVSGKIMGNVHQKNDAVKATKCYLRKRSKYRVKSYSLEMLTGT